MSRSFLQSLPSHKKRRKHRHRERRSGSQTEKDDERISQKSAGEMTAEAVRNNHHPNQAENQTNDAQFVVEEEIVEKEETEDQDLLSAESCVAETEFQYPVPTVNLQNATQGEESVGLYSPLSGLAPNLSDKRDSKSIFDKRDEDDNIAGGLADGSNDDKTRQIELPPLNGNGRLPAVDSRKNQQICYATSDGTIDKHIQLIGAARDSGKLKETSCLSHQSCTTVDHSFAMLNRSSTKAVPDNDAIRSTNNQQSKSTGKGDNSKTKDSLDSTVSHSDCNNMDSSSNNQNISSKRPHANVSRVCQSNVDQQPSLDSRANSHSNQTNIDKEDRATTVLTKSELCLTSSDIMACTEEINGSYTSAQSQEELFSNVDTASFQATLEKFQQYLHALSQPTSIERASFEKLHPAEWACAIFEKGMGVTHCNVCFICEMIEHITIGIEDSNADAAKLRHLQECIELVFGVCSESDSDYANNSCETVVCISSSNGCTNLQFKRKPSSVKQAPQEMQSIRQFNQELPTHLNEISKIFEEYSNQKVQPLQQQLDLTRNALAKTREGAVELQKTALDLQDQLHHARLDADDALSRQTELESAFSKQKNDFEKQLKSFDRVKEHYKRLLEQKEQELTDARAQIRQDSTMPETADLISSAHLPTIQSKIIDDSKRRQPEAMQFQHGAEAEAVTRSTKRNRISVEPDLSRDSIVKESPPISSPHTNDDIPRQHQHQTNNQRSQIDRNPLGSLAVNKFLCQPTNDNARDVKPHFLVRDKEGISNGCLAAKPQRERTTVASKTAKPIQPPKRKHVQMKNPYAKVPSQERYERDHQYDFKYREVVRGREARAALPAHECEACRKFNDAVYAQTGADMPEREEMVKACSRHRARFAPELTPADFWETDFIDEM
eukprot:scaffold105349_cov72-Cyclotella_meneghiniana.AAC.1